MGASFSIDSGSLAGVTPVFLGDHDAGCTLPYETAMERLAAPRRARHVAYVLFKMNFRVTPACGMWLKHSINSEKRAA